MRLKFSRVSLSLNSVSRRRSLYLLTPAGVSKYKERRRETEFRLRDTRENLSRIQDVVNEIIQQIAKLESQAVIATKYNELTEKHKFHQAQVWVLKKRDASIVWKKHQSQVEKLVNELEQQTAVCCSNSFTSFST